MAVFVVFALSLAVLAVAGVVVAVLQVRTAAQALLTAVHRAESRLRPLLSELEDELAVASTEVEALTQRRAQTSGVEPPLVAYTGGEGDVSASP